jgi:hypothetical protein
MMGYMGSMLVLFSDFFIKRYILKKQAYDMCGASAPTPFAAFFPVAGTPVYSTSCNMLLRSRLTATPMCHAFRIGVIKSVEFMGGPTCSAYHGNSKLSPAGQAIVRMPSYFAEVSQMDLKGGSSHQAHDQNSPHTNRSPSHQSVH